MYQKISVSLLVSILFLNAIFFSQVLNKNNVAVPSMTQGGDCKALQEFFLNSLISARSPGGIILTKNSCPLEAVFPEYNTNELSLKDKLSLITQMNPNYSWVDQEGIINLYPSEGIPELFNVTIRNLEIQDNYSSSLIIDKILQLPEVIEKLKELKLNRGLEFGGLTSPPRKAPPSTLVFKNKSLQEVLNEVARMKGTAVWMYKESIDNGKVGFSLKFLVN